MERALLILDLDETLVWARHGEEGGFDFRTDQYIVTRRPHLDPFLERVNEWYDLAVWTSSGDTYAKQVVEELFGDVDLSFSWSRSRCTERVHEETREPYFLKNLKKVKRLGFDLGRVLIIDDSPEKILKNYGNYLRVRPFEGQPDDRELLDVAPYLEWLKDQADFREIEKRHWRNSPH